MLEEGIDESVVQALERKGHKIQLIQGHDRAMFGRGQVITRGAWWADGLGQAEADRDAAPLVYWAGSDPRADGQAAGF